MVVPNPQAAADLQQALQNNERVRKASELPLFFGVPSKDTISAKHFLDRIAHAARIAGWGPERTLDNFYMLLRDRAIVWWEQLEDNDVDIADWEAVKTEFLAAYEPKFTARTTCTNFSDLSQRMGEKTYDYYLRLCEVFKRMKDTRPENMSNVITEVGDEADDDDRVTIKVEGMNAMEKYFRHQFFIAGLRPDLRNRVMEAAKETISESVKYAVELEVINQDSRRAAVNAVTDSGAQINAVAEDLTEIEGFESMQIEDQVKVINALMARNGRFRPRPPGGSTNRGPIVCRYCKKPGHMQKECNLRIKNRAPCVDAQGKPFQRRNKIAAVDATGSD